MAKSKNKKPTMKQRAKKAGRKAKKAMKSDIGRAGIGGGIGALALGPIGAVAGAGVAVATKKKAKKTKRNPDKKIKLAPIIGEVLLDYHQISESVEHVAASALRGDKVELSIVKRARNDLNRSSKTQIDKNVKSQLVDIVSALDSVLERHNHHSDRLTQMERQRKGNPVRAFSLEAELKRGRQSKAKKAATKHASHKKVAQEVSAASLRKRLARINPGQYEATLPSLTKTELDKEYRALGSLIKRAEAHPSTSKRMVGDLKKIRLAVDKERKQRNRKPNPVRSGDLTDKTLNQLASSYRRRRLSHLNLVTSPGSSPGEIARSQKRLDDAEAQLVLYAEIRNMDPLDLQRIVEHAKKKTTSAKSRKRKSNPTKIKRGDLSAMDNIPRLGSLERLPRATYIWETTYTDARSKGSTEKKAAKKAWGAVEDAGYYIDTVGLWRTPRRRFNPGDGPIKNPLKSIPKSASTSKARDIISQNIAMEMDAGRPQKQAVAIALSSARRERPSLINKLYGPRPNPQFQLDDKTTNLLRKFCQSRYQLLDAVKRQEDKLAEEKFEESGCRLEKLVDHLQKISKKKLTDGQAAVGANILCDISGPMEIAIVDEIESFTMPAKESKKALSDIKEQLKTVKRGPTKRKSPARKKSAKAKGAAKVKPKSKKPNPPRRRPSGNPRKSTPEWKKLCDRCQNLWDAYCERPTRKRLREIFAHLDKMAKSPSKKVKDERARCLRAANKEANRLRMR